MRGLDRHHLAQVTRHPLQLQNLSTLQDLLTGLDACVSARDMYWFQRDLFGAIHTIESRRASCSQAAKRLRQGKPPQAAAPDLQPGADPNDASSWELELFVAERVARQLRCVGDGLAWKAFRHDRRFIYALSGNEPSGPIVGKAGLQSETDTVDGLWKERQHFGLLHDLTTCIRIADVTEFGEGQRIIHEVKKSGRSNPAQSARAQAAIDAIMNGGPLPGADEDTRLTMLRTDYRTDLRKASDVIRLARERGVQGISLPEGRMVFAASLFDVLRIHHGNTDAAPVVRHAAWDAAIRRADISDAGPYLIGASSDRVGRSPIAAPLSIFPLSVSDRAALICDFVTLEMVMPLDVLGSLLEERGLAIEAQPHEAHQVLRTDTEVLHIRRGSNVLGVSRVGLDPLMFEAMRPSTWCDGIVEVFNQPSPPAHPALVWREGARSWRSPSRSPRRQSAPL